MTSPSISVAAVAAAPLSVASSSVTKAGAIASAAHHLLLHIERGQRIDAPMLRKAMENAFGASDADGGWNWKTAYDAWCDANVEMIVDMRGVETGDGHAGKEKREKFCAGFGEFVENQRRA